MSKTQKVCIVTGASSGLGFEATKKMAALGYEVVLGCQNKSKAKLAMSRIKNDFPEAQLKYMNLDLSSFRSIERFSSEFHLAGKKLNVLINNAAWMDSARSRVPSFTQDGFEKTFGVNHLGHFLLTSLLLDVLKSTAKFDLEARVVVLSSAAVFKPVRIRRLDTDDLQLQKPGTYNGKLAYKNSKLANVLFAYELHRRLTGTGVSCNVLNPGFVPSTNIFRNQNCVSRCCLRCLLPCCCPCMTNSVNKGASAVVFVASDSQLRAVSGRYFTGGDENEMSLESKEADLTKQLWELTEQMVASAAS